MKTISRLFTLCGSLLLLVFCATFSVPIHAEMVDTYQFKTQQDRNRAVELAKSLRCPQCQNQNLVESNSPIAYDLRIEVYKMVDEGKTNQQIIDTMTARFGHFVNYKPPFQWNTALLWGLPLAVLLLAFGLIVWPQRNAFSPPPSLRDTSPRKRVEGSVVNRCGHTISPKANNSTASGKPQSSAVFHWNGGL